MSSLLQAIPPSVLSAFWPIIAICLIVAAFWAAFSWLIARIDERFKAAIQSDDFRDVVDRRVTAAFSGAIEPLMAGQRAMSKEIGSVETSARAAHRRLDAIGAPRMAVEGEDT